MSLYEVGEQINQIFTTQADELVGRLEDAAAYAATMGEQFDEAVGGSSNQLTEELRARLAQAAQGIGEIAADIASTRTTANSLLAA